MDENIVLNMLNTVPENVGPMLDEFPFDCGLDLRLAVVASYGLRFLANLWGHWNIQCHRSQWRQLLIFAVDTQLVLARWKLLVWLLLHVNLLLTHCLTCSC